MSIVSELLFGVKVAIIMICFSIATYLQLLLYISAKKDKNIVTYGMLVGTVLLEAYVILSTLESYGY